MAWSTRRGVLGGSLAVLLLAAPTTAVWAQGATPTAHPTAAKPAPKHPAHTASGTKTKPAVAKTAARHQPAHPVKKLAAKPARHLAAAKRIGVAKKAEPNAVAVAETMATPASYTITTMRDGVTQTTTRIVPLTPIPAPVVNAAAMPSAAPAALKAAAAAPQPAAAAKPVAPGPQVASVQPQIAAIAAAAMAPVSEKPVAAALPALVDKPDAKAAAAFISAFLKEAFQIATSDGTSLQRRARLADLFAGKMDVKRIAGYTTADELSGASNDIQQRFRTILVSYLVETYYPQLELASDPSVTVDTAPVEPLPDGTAVVWTTFTKDGWGSQSVKWHLLNEDGHYKIVDIFSAGASLVQMERDTFVSVMRNGGLNELMAKLDQRTKQLATAATE